MKKCPNCGKVYNDDDTYCFECGTDLTRYDALLKKAPPQSHDVRAVLFVFATIFSGLGAAYSLLLTIPYYDTATEVAMICVVEGFLCISILFSSLTISSRRKAFRGAGLQLAATIVSLVAVLVAAIGIVLSTHDYVGSLSRSQIVMTFSTLVLVFSIVSFFFSLISAIRHNR